MATLPSILIAEDDDATRNLLRATLVSLGYPIAGVARDGREAVEKTFELNPGALLLDVGGAIAAAGLVGVFIISSVRNARALYLQEPLPKPPATPRHETHLIAAPAALRGETA